MESRAVRPDVFPMIVRWSCDKRRSFPRWELNEVISEAFLAVHQIEHRYEEKRGSYLAFLYSSLYCPVSRSYFKAFSITVNGKREGKRIYRQRWCQLESMPKDTYVVEDKVRVNLPDHDGMLQLLARGLTARQTAAVIGVTESRISQRLRVLRENSSKQDF